MDVEVEEGRDTAEVEDTAETTSMLLSPTAQPRPRTVTCIRQAQTALLFISAERSGIKAFFVSGVDSSPCHEIHLDMVIWSMVIMGSKEHYI